MPDTLPQPKFAIGQLVKFKSETYEDHDRMTGKVLSFSFHSANASDNYTGYEYRISSRYYDMEKNDMVQGFKICKEEELVDMTGYDGSTAPIKPDKNVDLSDSTSGEKAQPATAK